MISATNGKTTTAAMVASILERTGSRLVHNRAGANMAGGVASALAAASRRGGRALDGDLGLFEVDEFWLGPVVEELQPRALLLANLFRDQLDRYGELDTIADRWAAVVERRPAGTQLVLNADDPLVADLGRKTRGAVLRRRGRAWPTPSSSTPRTPSTAATAGTPTSTTPPTSATSAATTAPTAATAAPSPAVAAESVQLRGIRSAAFTLRTPAGLDARRAAAARPLQRLQRARRRRAVPRARASSCRRSSPASAPSSRPSAAPRRSTSTAARPRSCWSRTRPGANEVLRTLALEGGELDLFGVLNDRIADGRDVSWVWDADWELLAPHVRAHDLLGHARRRAGPAHEVRRRADRPPAGRRGLAAGLDAALAGGRGPLYALPTYTALLELRELLADRGQAREYWR